MSQDTTLESGLSAEEIIATISVLLLAGIFILYYLWSTDTPQVITTEASIIEHPLASPVANPKLKTKSEAELPLETLSEAEAHPHAADISAKSTTQAIAEQPAQVKAMETEGHNPPGIEAQDASIAAASLPPEIQAQPVVSSLTETTTEETSAPSAPVLIEESVISAVEHDLANGNLNIQGTSLSANESLTLSINGKETPPFQSNQDKNWQYNMAIVPGEYYIRIIESHKNTQNQPMPAVYNISVSQDDEKPNAAHTRITLLTGEFYQVKSGDSLSQIARTFNAKSERLVEVNGLPDKAAIKANDILFIPR
ncbi:MAG TPA: LysM domain-containing protein [Gammaproteobacteria bacterium]|nr:LysM domain-containing protein [Gammaproteobacteria bacterium]